MPINKETTLEWAHTLLAWNREHLRAAATLTETLIAQRFAPHFVVEANGRRYDANHRTYLEFLNGFRSTIATIGYEVRREVVENADAMLAMQARVQRTDGRVDLFEAMLLLRFDESGRVTLWHEVYVKID